MIKNLLIKIIDKTIAVYSKKTETNKDFRVFAKNSCHYIICGHVSGYKPCCIAFFTFIWSRNVGKKYDKINKIWVERSFISKVFQKIYFYINGLGVKNNRGYIACPLCILTRRYTKSISCSCSSTYGKRIFANENIPIWYLKNIRTKLSS